MEDGNARIASLGASVKRGIRKMQTDGLSRQLEINRTSCQFVPRRLTEVLRDFIEMGREKEIQRVLHEIDNTVFERDRLEVKLEKVKLDHQNAIRRAKAENRQLNGVKQALYGKIEEARQRQVVHTSRFEKAIVARQRYIRNTNVVLAKSKALLTGFAAELSELRADVLLNSATAVRAVKSSFNKVKTQAGKLVYQREEIAKRAIKKQIKAKKDEVEAVKAKTSALKNSLDVLKSFICGMGVSSRIVLETDDATAIGDVFAEVIQEQEEDAVQQVIASGGESLVQLVRSRTEFAKSARKIMELQLAAKKEELDDLIAQARKRRLKLQEKLDTAVEQLRGLQGSRISEDLSSTGPQFDFESTTKQLDATLSKLGRELAKE